MRRTFAGLGLALCMAGMVLTANAQQFSLKQVQLKAWTPKGDIQKVVGKKLYDLIDGFADIHMGFDYLDSEHVTLGNGKSQLEVSVFRVDTSDNGYGLYSCLRDRGEGKPFEAGNEASYAYGTAIVWAGRYVVEVKDISEEPVPDKDVIAVAKAVSRGLAGKNERPKLVRAFPKEKLDYKGLIYFHHRHPLDQVYYLGTENPLQLGVDAMKPSGVEAVYADYKLAKGVQGILALNYKTPKDAAKALADYTKSLGDEIVSTDNQPPWRVLTAKNGKKTIAFQKNRLLILAFESTQAQAARKVIARIAQNLEPRKKPKLNAVK